MKKLANIGGFLVLAIVLLSSSSKDKLPKLYSIPEQNINLNKLIGDTSKHSNQTIHSFQISEQVTYEVYKEYLAAIRKDSSQKYCSTQLPDTSIGPKEVYKKYLTSKEYDSYPALGISWDNAMNFCKWKTLNDNNDTIKFIYRLAFCSEWLAAYTYLSERKIKSDFNKNYSDWLISSMDESAFDFSKTAPNSFHYDRFYLHKHKDALVLKRKLVIGNSYLYQQKHPLANYYSFYATTGYRQIAFRYVKEYIRDTDPKQIGNVVLKYWGLKK